jgi:hypothetical protein
MIPSRRLVLDESRVKEEEEYKGAIEGLKG